MLNSGRSKSIIAAVVAAVVTATGSVAHAAFIYSIASDTSSRTTDYVFPTTQTVTSSVGPLYTSGGAPILTAPNSDMVSLNFNSVLSPSFLAQVNNSSISVGQSTDGKLVINLHFDTAIPLVLSLYESGLYSTTGNGAVAVNGGLDAIEAVDATPHETESGLLNAVFGANGGWTATATTTFTGAYTDYQISIDNNLVATATAGTASIFKKDFILTISGPGVGTGVPEPASLGLLGFGALALIARRRR